MSKYTEVREVLKRLVTRGYTIESIDLDEDEGEWTLNGGITPQDAYDKIMEYADEAVVYISKPNEKRRFLHFVIGNEPGVALSDYSAEGEDIEAVADEVYEMYNNTIDVDTAVVLQQEVEKCKKAILESTECFTDKSNLYEMVSVLISQRDNAYLSADHFRKQVKKYENVV